MSLALDIPPSSNNMKNLRTQRIILNSDFKTWRKIYLLFQNKHVWRIQDKEFRKITRDKDKKAMLVKRKAELATHQEKDMLDFMNLEKCQELITDQFRTEFSKSFKYCSSKIQEKSKSLLAASRSKGKEHQLLISSCAHTPPSGLASSHLGGWCQGRS